MFCPMEGLHYCAGCSDRSGSAQRPHPGQSCAAALEDRMDVRAHVNALGEALSLRCPLCKAVWAEFDGCCSVTCANPACTPAVFCGWCCQDCTPDAHSHAVHCALNPNPGNVRGTAQELRVAHWGRRRQAAQAYLHSIADLDLRVRVARAVRALLLADGVRVEDILGCPFTEAAGGEGMKGGGGGK